MKDLRVKVKTWLFVAGFLLAGLLHVLDRVLNVRLLQITDPAASALPAFGSTVLFVLNLAIYCLLLLWWLQSVSTRLLPSRGRTCIIAAAWLMLAFLLIRSVKYRLAPYASLFEHVCWYAYYVPLALIPALFLVTCLRMDPDRRWRVRLARLTWWLAVSLALGVVTNDFHRLMFRPIEDVPLAGSWGGYTVGPLWYVFYGYIILSVVLGLVTLGLTDRRGHRGRRTLLPALLLLGMLGMMVLVDRFFGRLALPFPWAFPEIAVFCMLGIFESCIRSRLIPYNDRYGEFFSQMRLTAEIDDPALTPVFQTSVPVNATEAQKRSALTAPILLDPDTRLYGKPLRSGCAFWTGDERTINRLNEDLADAAEVLETENELLRYEAEQVGERARVDARNRVYARAAQEVYGTQKQIAALLDRLRPDAPDYRDVLARILLLDAYVKRKTNFVLQSAERADISAQELYLALDESARFLSLSGVRASVERKTDRAFSNQEAAALYDTFEALIERLALQTPDLLISLSDDALRLMAECPLPEDLPETPARVDAAAEGGQTYLTVRWEKGGAA